MPTGSPLMAQYYTYTQRVIHERCLEQSGRRHEVISPRSGIKKLISSWLLAKDSSRERA